jgi:hypothetical protein
MEASELGALSWLTAVGLGVGWNWLAVEWELVRWGCLMA